MNPTSIDTAILSTLAYAGVFHSGICVSDLYPWLLTSRRISVALMQTSLRRLEKSGLIVQEEGVVLFAKDAALLKQNKNRLQESERKFKMFADQISLFTWMPTIVGVAVTGSVAARNSKTNDDIDVMVITAPGTLWLTRVVVIGLSFLYGKLRYGSMKHTQNLWCFNVWLDEQALALTSQTPYIAREVIQSRWVIDRRNIRKQLLQANPWIRQFVANIRIERVTPLENQHWWILSSLEFIAYWVQRAHMHASRTREVVTPHSAFFHPRNTEKEVLIAYEQLQSRIMKKYSTLVKLKNTP